MVYDVEVMHLGKKFPCSWCLDPCHLREKKEIVNLLLDFGSSIMCWFTHLSHLFVAFFISFAYIHQLVTSNFCCAKVLKKKSFHFKS